MKRLSMMRLCIKRLWHAIILLSLACPLASHAHKASDSYLQIDIAQSEVSGRWDIALRDLEQAIGLDADMDGNLTWAEVRSQQTEISNYALSRLKLSRGAEACTVSATRLAISTHVDGRYAAVDLRGNCPAQRAAPSVKYNLLFDIDRQHRGLAVVTVDDQAHSLVFGPDTSEQVLEARGAWKTFTSFVVEGIHHILIGYDHILFLISLLLPAVLIWRNGNWDARPGFKSAFYDAARTVTAFTLAHSITLALAALGILSIESRIIESVIALSVVLAAANNLRPFIPGKRWGMAFVFGLVHGFGFASVLSEIGLPREQLAIALGGFNLGVEAGQLLIVTLVLPLTYLIRSSRIYRSGVMRMGSVAIMLIAAYWFCQRAFGLS